MPSYQHADTANWFGRTDGNEPDVLRWHQAILCADLDNDGMPPLKGGQQGVALLGFCCEEGVARNQGRVGAVKGPQLLRDACRNLPMNAPHLVLVDAGDVVCDDHQLEVAQDLLAHKVMQIREAGYLPVVMGGGHEVAFGNFWGIKPVKAKQEFGVINFDAHFDLRSALDKTGPNSGTGFWQMNDWCKRHDHPFHYLAIGIQQYSNTRRLFETADDMGAQYFLAEEFTNDHLNQMVQAVNGIMANSDILQLTIDLDVFAACHAPGVSAPAYNGIAPNSMFKRLVRHIALSSKLASVDIAELNPKYDIDNRTAKLAATIIYDIVQAVDVNAEYPY